MADAFIMLKIFIIIATILWGVFFYTQLKAHDVNQIEYKEVGMDYDGVNPGNDKAYYLCELADKDLPIGHNKPTQLCLYINEVDII